MKIKTFLLLVLFFSTFCFNSCSLFKKKNKCDTCPSWTQGQNTSFEELDSKYRLHKNIPLKNYKTNFISAILINSKNDKKINFSGNVIPEKS